MTQKDPDFGFRTIAAGWAYGWIGDGESGMQFRASYLSDFVGEFLALVRRVATGEIAEGECRAAMEPGYADFHLRLNTEQPPEVELTVTVYPEIRLPSDDELAPVLSITYDARTFAARVEKVYTIVLNACGDADYQTPGRWGHPFPHEDLTKLRAWLGDSDVTSAESTTNTPNTNTGALGAWRRFRAKLESSR